MFSLLFLLFLQPIPNVDPPDKLAMKWLERVNLVRSKSRHCGRKKMSAAKPLIWNDLLEKSARLHAKDMGQRNFFSHSSRDGRTPGDRVEAVGYPWAVVGENIAEGQQSIKEVVRDWLESPTHCSMLMNSEVSEMGMARVGAFWVQNFGSRLPEGAVLTK